MATAGAAKTSSAAEPIRWRMQTYAGAALAEHVIKPQIDAFNKAANGEMVIELYTSDQLVPTSELFRAVQRGTIDAAQCDEDSMSSPADVAIFGAYFPFATRYSWMFRPCSSTGASIRSGRRPTPRSRASPGWGPVPGTPATLPPPRPSAPSPTSRASGCSPFPTGGRFMSRFGVIPVSPAVGGHPGGPADG